MTGSTSQLAVSLDKSNALGAALGRKWLMAKISSVIYRIAYFL
jgi:hypothetical protein